MAPEADASHDDGSEPLLPGAEASLNPVSQTSLITLSARADDAKSATPILNDVLAVSALDQIGDTLPRSFFDKFLFPAVVLRSVLFDRWTAAFLRENPQATVVHLACGMDTRPHRLTARGLGASGSVRWIDVDVAEVIALRRRVLPAPEAVAAGDYALVAASVLDPTLLGEIPDDRPTLVVMEGLLAYLGREDVYSLVERIAARFSRGQIVFDVCQRPFSWLRYTRAPSLQLGSLLRFFSTDATELADVSRRLVPTDRVLVGEYPGQHLCPWPMRLFLAVLNYVPGMRAMTSSYRFEIRGEGG